jgi:(R)-2-hydroxyacyl-CoA dehydratese activating ATPase
MIMNKLFLGIDVGSVTTKSVIISADRVQLGSGIIPTGVSVINAVAQVTALASNKAGISKDSIQTTVATGYGRNMVSFADVQVTEITCHARGAFEKVRQALTLIDLGGQDSKAISIAASGKVNQFVMNDRCAAGTGRFLEVMARILDTDLENMAKMAITASHRATINNMCTVFAESEVVGLIAQGANREDIAQGLCWSIAERISGMAKKVGIDGLVYLSGGVAQNPAVVSALTVLLGKPVQVIDEPQLNGAFGAALIAAESNKTT